MPSSTFSAISPIMDAVKHIQPISVLDVGCGYGKYGFLCREFIELWMRKTPKIDAIEVHEPYVTNLQNDIYDTIFIGEAINELTSMDGKAYDLILAIDIIEHFEEKDGLQFIHELLRVGKNVVICTPTIMKPQGAVFNNEYETHRKQWSVNEIANGRKENHLVKEEFTIVVMGEKVV